jgi:hypothetical protein
MRIFGLLTAFGLSAFTAHAQKVKLTWGEESKQELSYGSLVPGTGTEMVKLCFETSGGGLFSKKVSTPILAEVAGQLTWVSWLPLTAISNLLRITSCRKTLPKYFSSAFRRTQKKKTKNITWQCTIM